MKAQVEALRSQGLGDGEIADVLGVDVRAVEAVNTSGKSKPARAVLVSEDEAVEFTDVLKDLARNSESEFVRLSSAKWLVGEHFGRNDKREGVNITNNHVTLVASAIQAANAKQAAKLGLLSKRPATTPFDMLPEAPPAP